MVNPMMAMKAAKALSTASTFAAKNPKAMGMATSVGRRTVAGLAGGQPVGQSLAGAAAGAMGVKPNAGPQQSAPAAAAPSGPGKMTVTFGSKGLLARKDGRYYLHKGEKVVAKRSVPKVTKAMQKGGMRVRHKGAAAVKKVPFVALSKLRKMGNGGTVLKTGLHVLKAGQRVIPAAKVAKAKKAIKKA